MKFPLLRALLIAEFLIAIQAIFTFWSQVGGQYHLDLMFWPWKFGIGVAAALLIASITSCLVQSGGAMTRRVWWLGALLVATVALAGVVTYYYHLHEPADEDDQGDQQTTLTWNRYQTRQELAARTIA
jgi:glucan phosphoethanolaminetransferase (alkaline phosphatase superfamily)